MPTVRYTVINGEVIAEKRNGVRRLYVPDPLGSTVALVDNTQTITDRFSYWPYGEEASRTGTTPTPFRFVGAQGYYRDRLNSIYVRRRHYRPDVGRWTSQDPVGLTASEPNLYWYVSGRPSADTDPSGLMSPGGPWPDPVTGRLPLYCYAQSPVAPPADPGVKCIDECGAKGRACQRDCGGSARKCKGLAKDDQDRYICSLQFTVCLDECFLHFYDCADVCMKSGRSAWPWPPYRWRFPPFGPVRPAPRAGRGS